MKGMTQTTKLNPQGEASRGRKRELLDLEKQTVSVIQTVNHDLFKLDEEQAIEVSYVTRNLIHSLILLRNSCKKKPTNQELYTSIDRVLKRFAIVGSRLDKNDVSVDPNLYNSIVHSYSYVRDYARTTLQ